jgi:hypothetical protein
LLQAAYRGHAKVLQALLALEGVDPDIRDGNGCSPVQHDLDIVSREFSG